MKKYDVVLVERPCSIDVNDLALFPSFIDGNVQLLDIMSTEVESCAMGVIRADVAEMLDYDYSGLSKFVCDIMNDMKKETDTGEYLYVEKEISMQVLLTRNLNQH